ncbi:hypothetical protein D8674_039706 [Pyrus ussuriensis x Pyrus communis]|uniref:CCHC-type domain-containing protein n=1 Tax=Pyrus ussuriensis x Pyrus communis TaxID=2448454 RepID=A0A5N5F7I8_9ROSA|nr:hypothetical protein D8674_039706 [Pyrus ussuriensis x Pyrus communis]
MGKLPRGRRGINGDSDWLLATVQLGGLYHLVWYNRSYYGRWLTGTWILMLCYTHGRVDKRAKKANRVGFWWFLRKGAGIKKNIEIQAGRVRKLASNQMANRGVEELVVQLNQTLELSSMEQGIKLVGKVLTQKPVNKWGVRNILRAAWQELGEIEINGVATKIIEQGPWAVMKKVFSVVKWPPELALEELELDAVPFWVQIRGVPLGLASVDNIHRLTMEAGKFLAMEDPGLARGFLRVRILVDTEKPLFKGCWIRRDNNRDTWVEFRYERLQDFCYRCGRIGHINTECSGEVIEEGAVAFGEWLKAPPVRDVAAVKRVECVGRGERRQAGAVRRPGNAVIQNHGCLRKSMVQGQESTQTVESGGTPTGQSLGPKKMAAKEAGGGRGFGEDPGWGIKRGVESQEAHLTPVSLKKPRGTEVEEKCQGRVANRRRSIISTEGIKEHQERKEEGGKESGHDCSGRWRLAFNSRRAAMSYIFWNCRGLGSDTTTLYVFLSETKMKDHRICGVRKRLGYAHGFDVSPIGRSGGLSLWWEDNLEVKIIFSSKYIIDAVMRGAGQTHWCRFTGVYGTPYRNEKSGFWDWMGKHFTPHGYTVDLWRDFINIFIWDHEKSGGVEVLYNRPRFLEEFMSSSQLLDLGFHGSSFTWRGVRRGEMEVAGMLAEFQCCAWNGHSLGSLPYCPELES